MISATEWEILATVGNRHGIEIYITMDGVRLESLNEDCLEILVPWSKLHHAVDPAGIVQIELLMMCTELKS